LKTLFLIRHAKSSWDHPELSDQQRPLTRRGRRDARRLGKRLAKRDRKPGLMLSSPALRTLQTAQLIAGKLGYGHRRIVVDARLYACGVSDLLRVIHQLDDRRKRVMLFGHNPELTALARRFSDDIHHLPTCAAARFKFDVRSWTRVAKATLVTAALDVPQRARASAANSANSLDSHRKTA
jgi:phosphohistidine phosphatase